jgi:transcriptional regulator with XRE-family HTH domain
VQQTHISRIELGKIQEPEEPTLERLAANLGVSVSQLRQGALPVTDRAKTATQSPSTGTAREVPMSDEYVELRAEFGSVEHFLTTAKVRHQETGQRLEQELVKLIRDWHDAQRAKARLQTFTSAADVVDPVA